MPRPPWSQWWARDPCLAHRTLSPLLLSNWSFWKSELNFFFLLQMKESWDKRISHREKRHKVERPGERSRALYFSSIKEYTREKFLVTGMCISLTIFGMNSYDLLFWRERVTLFASTYLIKWIKLSTGFYGAAFFSPTIKEKRKKFVSMFCVWK